MIKTVMCAFLVLALVPFSHAYSAEMTDTSPKLIVDIDQENIHVYRDAEGFVVVVGLVENNDPRTSVSNVQIQANFFTRYDNTPAETTLGSSVLDVIPPNGKSPFSIRSETTTYAVNSASVSLLGFDSSTDKQKEFLVYSGDIFLDDTLEFSGVLKNGGAPNTNTTVYLAFYDGFEPPRILNVATVELGRVVTDAEVNFTFDETIDPQAVGFWLFAESNIFYSDFVDIKIPEFTGPTKKITISHVSVNDSDGQAVSELDAGSVFYIESKTSIEFSTATKSETPYTYYVQIKKSPDHRDGTPTVEYIGKFDGRFIGDGMETQTIDWIPQHPGLFFIETFVWDRNDVSIAEQGPYTLIIVR